MGKHSLSLEFTTGGGDAGSRCCGYLEERRGFVSFKCVLFIVLGLCLVVSTMFLLFPVKKAAFEASVDVKLNATIQASFRLQKPASLLVAQTKRLEDDLLAELGLPNTKVSILSINRSDSSNWSCVVFGVLPYPNNIPINTVSLSIMRSSLTELFLQQLNLSLTAQVFGQPSSFEILKLAGGITVIPVQSASIWQIPQVFFNFTLNNSISQIQDSFDQLKYQLKFGLYLMPQEVLYLQLSNKNGSTVDPPVTVQASILSDIGGSIDLDPQRLKRLAQIITGSYSKNLGLNHSVFGKVKEISLSSFLNVTLQPLQWSPSPSPSPSLSASPMPSPSPSPSLSLSPSPSRSHFPSPSPLYSDTPFAPIPGFNPRPASSPFAQSHSPSISPGLEPNYFHLYTPSPSSSNPNFPLAPTPPIDQVISPSPSAFSRISPSPSTFTQLSPSPSAFSSISPSPSAFTQLSPPPSAFSRISSSPSPSASSRTFPSRPAPPLDQVISPSPSAISRIGPNPDKRPEKAVVSPVHASSPSSLTPSSSVAAQCNREMWLIGVLGLLVYFSFSGHF